MKVFGNRVLIEQIVEEKISNILLPGGKNAQKQTKVSFKVLQVGPDVDPIDGVKPGDIPIFGKHTDFHGVKVISKEEDKANSSSKEVLHVIVYADDILGADDETAEPLIINEDTLKKA